jgi:hypothetical protein
LFVIPLRILDLDSIGDYTPLRNGGQGNAVRIGVSRIRIGVSRIR